MMQRGQSKHIFWMWWRGTMVEMTPYRPLSRSTRAGSGIPRTRVHPLLLLGKRLDTYRGLELVGKNTLPAWYMLCFLLLSLFFPYFSLHSCFAHWFFFSQLLLLSYLPYLFPNSLFFSFFSFSLSSLFAYFFFFYSTLTKVERNYMGERYSQIPKTLKL